MRVTLISFATSSTMYTTRQSPHRKAEMTLGSAGLAARATGVGPVSFGRVESVLILIAMLPYQQNS
jgi:hypothetical protein